MKKLIKLLAMLAIIASAIPVKGQIAVTYESPYTENFNAYSDYTLPSGWVSTILNGSTNWDVYSQSLRKSGTTPSAVVTARVTTPVLDLSAVSNYRVFMKFNHREAASVSSGNIDILGIYYKIGEEGGLVELDTFHNGATANQEAIIELPDEAKVSNLYIVFEEYSNGGGTVYVDDLVIYARPVYTIDAEASAITSPSSILENASAETPVTVSVLNFGKNSITDIDLTLEVDGVILVTENVDDWNLSADEITDYTFNTKADLSAGRVAGGIHKIRVWVDLAGDENRGDDTLELSLIVCGDTVVVTPESPYTEDFNRSLTQLPCWTNAVVGGTTAFALSSSVLRYYNYSGNDGESAYVTTPVLDLSEVTNSYKVFVAFDHKEGTSSINTDIPNILTVYYKTGDNERVKLDEFQNMLSSSNPYEHAVIELPEEAKVSNLTLIFEAVRQGSQAVYVDNVTVYCAEPEPSVPVAVTLESPYMESFDGLPGMALPAGWENHITSGNKKWRTQDNVLYITNKGTASANYAEKSYVTSSLNLSALAPYKAVLEFDHKESRQSTVNNGIDKLVVYYKIGNDGELVKLDSFQNGLSSTASFQHTVINLPNEAMVSNLYLAFEMQSNNSGTDAGIRIDNVTVYGIAPFSVTDLRVVDYIDLPETDTLMDGLAQLTVKIAIRNDSVEIGSGKVNFHYQVTNDNSQQIIKNVSEAYSGAIAEDTLLTYTFTEKADLTDAGSYTIKAWASFVGMPYKHFNLHKDTVTDNVTCLSGVQSAKMLNIDYPTGKNIFTADEKITVSFQNTGSSPITEINFSYQTNEGGEIVTETADDLKVAPGAGSTYTFTTGADLSATGQHNIKAWLTLAGDANNSDDTATISITCHDCLIEYPYLENFDDLTVANNCFVLMSMSTENAVTIDNYNVSGYNNFLRFSGTTTAGSYNQYAITPLLTPTSALRSLSFSYYAVEGGSMGQPLRAGYSTTTNDIDSFQWGSIINPTKYSGWRQHVEIDISTDVKYIALSYYRAGGGWSGDIDTYIDSLYIYEQHNDGAVTELISPDTTGINLTNQEPITVEVKNASLLSPLRKFNISYSIDGGNPVTESVSGVKIDPDSTFQYTFERKANLSAAGPRTIKVWIDVTDDEGRENDTLTKEILVVTCLLSFPYVQNFEAETYCLTAVSGNSANELGRMEYEYGIHGRTYVWGFSGENAVGVSETKDQMLIFPKMPADTLKSISLYYKNEASDRPSTLTVGYSTTDDPGSFTWYGGENISTTAWTYYEKTDIPVEARYIAIKFGADNNSASRLYIDSVMITGYIPVQITDLRVLDYVNLPATDTLLNGEVQLTVRIEIRNDSVEIGEGKVKFHYKVTNDDDGQLIKEVSEIHEDLIAEEGEITYTFKEKTNFNTAGIYTVMAWSSFVDMPEGHFNVHSDTVVRQITIAEPKPDPVPVTDLRVVGYVDMPETDTLVDGAVELTVKVAIRNDSVETGGGNVVLNYTLTGESSNTPLKAVAETYPNVIAETELLTYTFVEPAELTVAGSYTVRAWVSFAGMPDNHFNLHSDTIVETVVIVEPVVVGGEVVKSGLRATVYPNPSDGVVTVTVSSRSTVEIIDAKGVVTDRFTVVGSRQLPLKGRGLYMLNIIDDSGNRVTKRILNL